MNFLYREVCSIKKRDNKVINTEELKDIVARHFNTETDKIYKSPDLTEALKKLGSNRLQERKVEIIQKINEFEQFIAEVMVDLKNP